MTAVRYFIGVLLVVSIPPALVWWFLIHPLVDFWRGVGVKTTLWIVGSLTTAGLVALVFVRDALLGPDLGTHWALAGLGLAFMVLGAVIGFRRRRHLTRRILAGVPELEAGGRGGSLLTEGLYAVIRHPRYVEVAAFVWGYALVANFVGGYLTALATLLGLHVIVLLEERELALRFGEEYEAYRARVPRYLPRRDPRRPGERP